MSDSIPMSVCSSIFATRNINEHILRFPSEREVISEDFVFKYKYLRTSNKVVTTSNVGYSYRTNLSSLTTSYRPDRFDASLFFYDYALRLVADSPSESECVLRLKKTLFINMKMCISQEVPRVSGKSRRDACRAIHNMAGDERLMKVINDYPCERLRFKQKVFVQLLRHQAANVLYMAAVKGVI